MRPEVDMHAMAGRNGTTHVSHVTVGTITTAILANLYSSGREREREGGREGEGREREDRE
jgi:hypothetical protein